MAPQGLSSVITFKSLLRQKVALILLSMLSCCILHPTSALVTSGSESAMPKGTWNVPLQKQYVPVVRDGKTVAYKTAYFGDIEVGTPGQHFTVVFDTGSGHVLLPKRSCPSEPCLKHRRYDSTHSSTSAEIKYDGTPLNATDVERDQVVISFGTGKVTGEFARDEVCVGQPSPMCVKMRVVQATEMTVDPFSYFSFDGVFGLGLDALRLNDKFSFFGEMVGQNPHVQPQFSVFLSRQDDGQSMITFGGVDERRASTPVRWAPVAHPDMGYWQVQIKSINIGDTVLDDCNDGGCRAVLDTGTSLLGVPRQMSRTMHRLLARPAPADLEASEVDCRKVLGQTIEFHLADGFIVSVAVEDYSRPAPINMTTPSNTTALICRSLLLPTDMKAPMGPKLFIWGEPVLHRYLTVYDQAHNRVGFSLAKQPDAVETSSEGSSVGVPPPGPLVAGAPLPVSEASQAGKSSSATSDTKNADTVVRV